MGRDTKIAEEAMKLIDTHCHIQFEQYHDDRDELIQECLEKETGLMLVGCDYASSEKAIELAEKYQQKPLWAAVGQHPTDTGEVFDYKKFLSLARSSKKVVAVGECGLDYYHMEHGAHNMERQKELFTKHLDLAHEAHLPLIIHCRDSHDDMIDILVKRYGQGKTREHGVMHCFTGNWQQAQSYLDLGFLISFTGIITFASQYDDVVAQTPLDKILIETDSPYLTPTPNRGKKNKPYYVQHVAERIVQIKGISFDEVAHQTTENAKRLFRLAV